MSQSQIPQRRVVLLGASNLTRTAPALFRAARAAWGSPLEILGAFGHGRSFGSPSRFLVRTLPGIRACGLWEALDQRPALPTAGLVTDIGNDLLYGASVDQLFAWLDECLERLAPRCLRLVVMQLPYQSLLRLDPRWFTLLGMLFYPAHRVDRARLLAQVEETNDRLVMFASRYRAYVMQPRVEWFGFDAIHVRRRAADEMWRRSLVPWCDGRWPAVNDAPCHARWLPQRLRPRERWLLGIRQLTAQPCGTLLDGSPVSLF